MKVIFILFLKEHISSEIIHSAIVVDDDEVGIAIINSAKQSVKQIEFIHEELLSEVPSAMTKKRRSNTVKKIIKMQMDSSSMLLPPNNTKPIDGSCDNKIIDLSILQNNFSSSSKCSCQIFDLISSFLSNRRLRVVLDGKSSQEYPVNAGVPQGSHS